MHDLALSRVPAPPSNPTARPVWCRWNPHGHAPLGIYTEPHFDFHFYTVPPEAVASITPGPCNGVSPLAWELANMPLPEQCFPGTGSNSTNYINVPERGVGGVSQGQQRAMDTLQCSGLPCCVLTSIKPRPSSTKGSIGRAQPLASMWKGTSLGLNAQAACLAAGSTCWALRTATQRSALVHRRSLSHVRAIDPGVLEPVRGASAWRAAPRMRGAEVGWWLQQWRERQARVHSLGGACAAKP